jgi:hypothetical protein
LWVDGAGAVWVGTDGGVSRSDDDGNTWRTFGMDEGLGDNAVRSVWGDEQGNVWVGTLGGLSRSEDGGMTWQNYILDAGVLDNAILSVWGDSAGVIWAGTVDGVGRSDDGGMTWQTFTTTHGLGANFVNVVRGDGAGVVWAGTAAGVSRSDDGGMTWQTFGLADGLGNERVYSVWGDAAGAVWVGTEGGGVSRLTPDASPLPVASWLDPPILGSESSYRMLDSSALRVEFAGLGLAPAGGSEKLHYSAILSPTTATGQVINRPFPAPNNLSEPGVVRQVLLGSESEPLAFGSYELTLTAQDLYGNSSTTYRAIQVQASPVISEVVLYLGEESLGSVSPALPTPTPPSPTPIPLQPTPTLPQSPLDSPLPTPAVTPTFTPLPTAEPSPAPTRVLTETVIRLTTDLQGRLTPLTAELEIIDPDSPLSDIVVSYRWAAPGYEEDWRPLQGGVITASKLISGSYVLYLRAVDPDGNLTQKPLEVQVRVNVPPAPTPTPAPPGPTSTPIIQKKTAAASPLVLLFNLLLFAAVAGLVIYSLRHYLTYAGAWAAAEQYPLQQIIPLVAKRGESVDEAKLHPTLQSLQAFATDEQVRDALAALAEREILQREGAAFCFVSPWTARVHYWLQRRRIPALAERIRTQHPLYERARGFFDQAHFRLGELGAEEYMLHPQGTDHPQARYGAMYARLITGRATTGDDFTAVYQAAQGHYGEDLAHRVAVVISDQRPEPGARYRLYEIRQREGLAIVPLDSALFGQIKPNRTASDILAAEIDQATGQQNLYAISGPVSGDLSFFGRERVLQEVIDLLDAGQPVGIFGLRKVGKTSLIQRLQGRLSLRRPIAFVDTQGTTRQQGVWPFYPTIVEAFVEHLGRYRPGLALPELRLYPRPQVNGPEVADAFLQDLETLHEALGRPKAPDRMLLIVDEVDRLVPSGQTAGYEGLTGFFGQLRAANQQAQLLDLMLVGVDPSINRRERWQDHDNELYRALREVWMPPMAPKDVREMLESLGLQMGVRYGRQALARLARAGGGHPFVTRQMCSLVVQGRLGAGAITILPPEADAAIEEFVFQDRYLPEMWRTRLDETQREMLRQLARAEAPVPRADLLPASQRQAALEALPALEECTLAVREEAGYVSAWDVLRDWIRWVELGIGE